MSGRLDWSTSSQPGPKLTSFCDEPSRVFSHEAKSIGYTFVVFSNNSERTINILDRVYLFHYDLFEYANFICKQRMGLLFIKFWNSRAFQRVCFFLRIYDYCQADLMSTSLVNFRQGELNLESILYDFTYQLSRSIYSKSASQVAMSVISNLK